MASPCAFWPVTIGASNNKVDTQIDATTKASTLTSGVYYSIIDLLVELRTQLNASWAGTGLDNWGIGVGPSDGSGNNGLVTLTNPSGSHTYSVLFSTGANAASSPRHVLGFGAVDASWAGSSGYVRGTNQHQNGWYAGRAAALDTGSVLEHVRAQTVALSGKGKTLHYATRTVRRVGFRLLPETKMFVASETANQALERLVQDGYARFRWWDDAMNNWIAGPAAGIVDYYLEAASVNGVPWSRYAPAVPRHSPELKFRALV